MLIVVTIAVLPTLAVSQGQGNNLQNRVDSLETSVDDLDGRVSDIEQLLARSGRLCVTDAAFGNVWKLNITLEEPNGDSADLTMSRVNFSTIPLPSAGAWKAVGDDQGRITWSTAFAGSTQGTLDYACNIELAGGLPASGDGMAIRITSFNALVPEAFTGTCVLDLCSVLSAETVSAFAAPILVDPATQQ